MTDLDISWQLSKAVSLAVGANNLFDVYSEPVDVIQTFTGGGLYGRLAPIGLSGGFCCARSGVSFCRQSQPGALSKQSSNRKQAG